MLENCRNARERWGGVSELIDRWLQERQELLVCYCGLSAQKEEQDADALAASLVRLCELLVDYVSAGHFGVYEQLVREARDFDDGGLELIARLYPRIGKTTELVLAFNDCLDNGSLAEAGPEVLSEELSRLGEALESRFEMEDLLIEYLHNVHVGKLAAT